MKKALPWLSLFFFVCPVMGQAQTAVSDAQKRQLIEQKIRLVESLANSPTAMRSALGPDPETVTLLARGRSSIEAARAALAGERAEEAARLTDEALRAVSAASRRISAGSALSASSLRKDLQDLSEQVLTYRSSLADLTKDPKSGAEAVNVLTRLDALTAKARQLDADGYTGDAARTMATAYKLAVQEIARLRQGNVVTVALSFASKAEEFAYEQRRFSSNEILVSSLLGEGRAAGENPASIESLLGEGRRLKHQADAEANAARYQEAVLTMEKASAQLVRALQLLGVPIF